MPEPVRRENSREHDVPVRNVRLGSLEPAVERRADGVIYLKCKAPLAAYPDKITERLDHWARETPENIFMAERAGEGWRESSYVQTRRIARNIGEALLQRNLSAERPIVILSGNGLDHQFLSLGALYAGIPYAPVSPAYSLVSQDFAKLREIFTLLTPGLVFVSDGAMFAKAIEAVVPEGVEIVVVKNPVPARPCTLFGDLMQAEAGEALETAHAKIGPDTIAKFLFTSGSTGVPKAVINTQRMLCANQVMLRSALAFFQDEPPVTLDWAPWHHTAGGNHDVGLVLYNGGTFYIDEGKPAPGAIEATVRNLRDVACTWYFNVPKGYEVLIPYLRADKALRETFFSKLKVLWFAGAALSQPVFDAMKELAVETCGERIPFLTGLGSTETAPFALGRMWDSEHSTNMGLPAPGIELKLVPAQGKLEARLRGPNITPGYWRQPELTKAAFDEEGFYRLGDALKFEDPTHPEKGLLFDGRLTEDFKLSTGTWVSVGPLRTQIMNRFQPYMRDVVLAGENENEITALGVPDMPAIRALHPELDKSLSDAEVLAAKPVRVRVQERLRAFIRDSTGSSNCLIRVLLLDEPPSMDAGEMTDKGSLNQRALLARRAHLVKELYASPPSVRVIAAEGN
ncbi:MAG: feruloyl-CoA synthase [Xanthobacteraceae bacterium]|nr:feruloyl-CoA synthase [Xanthobacteraceae bacterium]QYK45232.1 MAG: feruloyl-CoA synthase [Xanthobacteraceae bacterium]